MIPQDYFEQEDVVGLARELVGRRLMTRKGGAITGGVITETEAYRAPEDKASHAYGMRRTRRTEVIYARGGRAYIYLCYGIHSLLNIVTGPEGVPHAILIRAIEPTTGIEVMDQRRAGRRPLAAGPGTVCQALGLTTADNKQPLGRSLWIEEGPPLAAQIQASPRIGIDYAEEWTSKSWRFHL